MEVKNNIGINQRIPISLLGLALNAVLEGEASSEYFRELASTEYQGQNRIGKAVTVFNRLTIKNPLMPFMMEHKEELQSALRNNRDKAMVYTAVICSAYNFGYNALAILGKLLHVQDSVTSALLLQKLAEKYGANRSLPNALYCILPMVEEAGIILRPKPGIIEAVRQEKYSDIALQIYKKSFLLNNPTYADNDEVESNPYFEFIQ